MKLLTCNVWFDPYAQQARAVALLDGALALDPDVVCFQEVTEAFLGWWRAHPLSGRLPAQATAIDDEQGYGLLLATRLPHATFDTLALPTCQGRAALRMQAPDAPDVVCVHLESRDHNALTRLDQLDALAAWTRPETILAGDLNFAPRAEEDLSLRTTWRDAWAELRPHDPGLTVDDKANPMRAWMRPERDRQQRLDRVCARRDGHTWQITTIDRCLHTPLPHLTPPVTPSDHDALIVTITRSNHTTV